MPVTPITPAQIDEVGKGACLTAPGSSPSGDAPYGSSSQATAIPSRGPATDHPAWVFYEWLHREYAEPNPEAGEAVTWIARPLLAALTSFCMAEGPFEDAPAFAAANPSGGMTAVTDAEIIEDLRQALHDIFWFPHNDPGDDSRDMRNIAEMALAGLDNARKLNAEALAGEAGTAETEGLGPKDDHAASSEATPSIPPSPRNGQEENPCPMTVDEARETLDRLFSHKTPREWVEFHRLCATYPLYSAELRDSNARWAARIELALSTIRASEEDR